MAERKEVGGIDIQSTLKAVHVAADLVLEYKQISEQAVKWPPYLPSVLELALAGEEKTDFRQLTPEQRLRINTGEEVLYSIMERRANLQAKWADHPDLVKQNILD